jgi:hypothetical protein
MPRFFLFAAAAMLSVFVISCSTADTSKSINVNNPEFKNWETQRLNGKPQLVTEKQYQQFVNNNGKLEQISEPANFIQNSQFDEKGNIRQESTLIPLQNTEQQVLWTMENETPTRADFIVNGDSSYYKVYEYDASGILSKITIDDEFGNHLETSVNRDSIWNMVTTDAPAEFMVTHSTVAIRGNSNRTAIYAGEQALNSTLTVYSQEGSVTTIIDMNGDSAVVKYRYLEFDDQKNWIKAAATSDSDTIALIIRDITYFE